MLLKAGLTWSLMLTVSMPGDNLAAQMASPHPPLQAAEGRGAVAEHTWVYLGLSHCLTFPGVLSWSRPTGVILCHAHMQRLPWAAPGQNQILLW